MTNPWIAAAFALFAWWFSTGAILFAVRVADRWNKGAMITLVSLPVLAMGIWGLTYTYTLATPLGAVYAFLAALAVWGWIELAFLTGEITGPNTTDCPEDVPEWERFVRAWGTLAYHELLLFGALIAVLLTGWGATNTFGVWTFVILFFARVSAKLNLYAGVPRINTEFLPRKLQHLKSHFRIARINWLFPLSVTALSFAIACWLERLVSTGSALETTGYALLGAITALALFEHWLMVLPLPDAKLWRWMLPAPATKKKTQGEMADGL